MESEVESIISPKPHNTIIYCNQVKVAQTKCYQSEKLKTLYSRLLMQCQTIYCAVSYDTGYFLMRILFTTRKIIFVLYSSREKKVHCK